jgi:hypothetical protein
VVRPAGEVDALDDVHRPDAKDQDGAGALVGDPANRPSGVKSR